MIHVSQTNEKDFDELVFKNRNQAYGAYVLRREYPRNVLKSLLIGIAMLAGILAIPYLANYFKKKVVEKQKDPILVGGLEIITPPTDVVPKTQKPPKGPKPTGNLINWATIKITDEFVEDTLPTDFNGVDPSTINHKGDGYGQFMDGPFGNGEELPTGDIDGEPTDILFIQEVPEFPGGMDAMYKFLDDNIVYPEHARNIGLQGKVYVTFVVDQFGNLTKIETPRPIGGGLDEEALRVIKLMPRWKPGKMNGRPVKVKYNLPIVFKLN